MAFRHEALVAIGGFNPTYLRAGDDVDVCWRLQKRGGCIGFAPAALVWHHHRPSLKQYWRQQVGYGEGEAWLKPHHPDKFSGHRILWQGTIYSPLPFVRSLSRRHFNTGPWGTAAFPSVYRTEMNHVAPIVHTPAWQLTAVGLVVAGSLFAITGVQSAAVLLAAGLGALILTVLQCMRCAWGTDIDSLPPLRNLPRTASRIVYRAIIAWLHLAQPFGRLHGRLRGLMRPSPGAHQRPIAVPESTSLTWRHVWETMWLLWMPTEERFWTETGAVAESLLMQITDRLRSSRAGATIEIDDGWKHDRDVSISTGLFGWLDFRLLVENHGYGKCLARATHSMRPTGFAAVLTAAACLWFPLAFTNAIVSRSPVLVRMLGAVLLAGIAHGGWRILRTVAAVDRAVADVMASAGLKRATLEHRSVVETPSERAAAG
jgi:hypothetical protein